MRLESRVLPRLVLRPPPIVSFLCFVIGALLLVAFSLKPRQEIFTPFEPNQTKIHIFCDMSPSVSAQVSLDQYARKMADLYSSLKDQGRISLSTSHGPEVIQPNSADEVASLIKSRGFHRGGLHLGSALKTLMAGQNDIDRLFVVSDRDQHSWTGFNWQYLEGEMDLVFYDLTNDPGAHRNLYINDARFLSAPSSGTMDWDVEITASGGENAEAAGKLDVTYMGTSLGSFPWKMALGKQHVNVRASWPASAITDIDQSGARDVPLVFRIEVDGGDAIALDNEFRTDLLGLKQDVLIISEAAGERLLEDPAQQLEVALDIQGFKLKRFDYITQPGPKPEAYPLMILLGGSGDSGASGIDRFCPRSLELARLGDKSSPTKHGARDGRRGHLPKVWLAPQQLDANYRDLCRCYARLLLSTSTDAAEPAFCQNVTTRNQWMGLLPSLGAKQIGGQMGDAAKALAWHARDQDSGLEVLAFTVPLTPSAQTGINHAEMPILIKELLTWEGLAAPKGGAVATWPRVEDIATQLWRTSGDESVATDPAELARLRLGNVPLGESLLSDVDVAQLPPRWTSQMAFGAKQLPAKKDREDPLPWLKLAAIIAVALSGVEAAWSLIARLARFAGKRPEASTLLVLLMLFGAATVFSSRAEAKVELNLIGYRDHTGPANWAMLAREVAHRTSIEMEAKPNTYGQLTPEALGEPWLWVSDLTQVADAAGVLKPEVALWLKRGGFLIIEAPLAQPQLAKLTSGLPPPPPGESGGWQPLPPDHEIMRSFYLLDALPGCNGEIWRGFEYDGRLAILDLPYGFLGSLKDRAAPVACANAPDQERAVRVFVNLVMVALATDYKKDQIHLPEILKRLR